ncbi:MAG: hypothetical protein FJ271_11660 [Planctomycetes bacterium]|nr:hypothetical protein [Planctomycetota bacterium]
MFRTTSAIGIASLSFLLGAAVIFFDLPSADFLRKAFLGAQAAYERQQALSGSNEAASGDALPDIRIDYDTVDKNFDGFTLLTIMAARFALFSATGRGQGRFVDRGEAGRDFCRRAP